MNSWASVFSCVLFLNVLSAQDLLPERIRRVQAHLLLDDSSSALNEAQLLVRDFPDSKEVMTSLIIAFASSGNEDKALQYWHAASKKYPDISFDRNLLEEVGWGVLKKGLVSTQYAVRLASLIGAFLTNDAKALPIIVKMMRDSNAVIRSVAVQMAAQYRDDVLKDEIAQMLKSEKVWMVRLEVIRSCGALRMKELAPQLEALIQSDKTTYEERLRAIEALCSMYDSISFNQWKVFSRSNRAGLRHFACNIAAHFKLDEAKEDILRLMHDTHPDVRIASLNAFGLYYRHIATREEIKENLNVVLNDPIPEVSITACWAALISEIDTIEMFSKWLVDPVCEYRRFAAAALASTGMKGKDLAAKMIVDHPDMYVKANLAMGLIGQREKVATCCDTLYQFLTEDKRMWMWDTRQNPLFQVLVPSQVRYVDHIPNYPEAIDQMTRLNLLSILALVEDARALEAVKAFLKKKSWGITGVAAATLLQEGDETSLEVVRELLVDSDPDVRLQACFVLAMFGRDESVISELQKAYSTSNHERKLHILESMGRIGSVDNFHFLLSAFNEPFPILRVAAAASLIQSIHR